jgi:hypothetical protein
VTALFTVLTLSLHDRTEQHLLDLQVRQAAGTLAAALPQIQTVLDDGLQVASATRSPTAFQRFVTAREKSGLQFSSVSLWQKSGTTLQRLALIGGPPLLLADGQLGFLQAVRPSPQLQITGILSQGDSAGIGYADMPVGGNGLIAYAESRLPPGRHLAVASSNPFHDVNFALYLNSVRPQNLLETTGSVRSPRATAKAPFGDSSIVLVGSSNVALAGGLSANLPWIVLGVGLVLTASTAGSAEVLARRRRLAEELAEENQRLYLEQRNIATTVQHALLPEVPKLEELEVGARYLAGTAGIDVGGDWYDVVCRPGVCTFVVGDVSGRGLRAATTMASLRFSIRAYLAQGDSPESIVEKLAGLGDFDGTEQFATLCIGQIDIDERQLTVVNAGHPPLLVVTPGESWFVRTPTSPPVGLDPEQVESSTVTIPEDGLLLAYTDGLVESRDQPLSAGLERLRRSGIDPNRPVEETLDRLVESLLPEGPVDDTAILALRWKPPFSED